jgi:hypothetical protein
MPQPIDMQSEMNRAVMAERIQEASTRASLAAQHRGKLDVEEDDRITETVVSEAEETSESQIAKDGRRKNPFVQRRKKKKQKSAADDASHTIYTSHEKKEIVDDPDGHDLDLMI